MCAKSVPILWLGVVLLSSLSLMTQGCQPFERTATSYPWDMTDAEMDLVCQGEFGPGFRLAAWEEVASFVQEYGLDEFYTQTGMTGYRSNGWLRGFYSSNRRYFAERHDGNVPSGWLVHAQIGSHDIDLGSYYNSRPILCYAPEASNFAQNQAP